MHARHSYGDITWVDLESPNAIELRHIATEFNIDERVAEELIVPFSKPRAEFFSGYVYLVMHFPALKHAHKEKQQEVDFVIGHNFLITVRYDTIDPLHKFTKVFEAGAALHTLPVETHAGYLFYSMLRKLYRNLDHELDLMRHELSIIEERIFSGREVEMVAAISAAARALLNLRQTIEPHRDILRSLEESGPSFFGDDFAGALRSLSMEYYRVHNHIMRATDSLHELRETNNSLLSTKQNETMKIFTIMAFFTFPLALLVDILAIPSKYNPIFDKPYDFWIIVSIVIVGLAAMYLYFKYKQWL